MAEEHKHETDCKGGRWMELCPMAGFGISGVEPSGSATRQLISNLVLKKIGCENGGWMELAQNRAQCPEISTDARKGEAAELPVLLPES
jgi:hypothetical protein